MKILHLEDNRHDAELTKAVIVGEWPKSSIHLVDSREGFISGLASSPDIILSDFSMPNFCGMNALEVAREQSPGTPFIFLSGTIGEERAVEALRSGASDYVLKDRPQRLIPAVRRALADAESARERRQLEASLAAVRRLENFRCLVSSIVHDLNNALSPIFMGASYVSTKLRPEDQKICMTMANSAQKAAALVKHISGISNDAEDEPPLLDLLQLLRDITTLAQHSFPADIEIKSTFAADLWPVAAPRSHMHQILFNLCLQARSAMRSNGGVMILRAHNFRHQDELQSGPSDLIHGDYVFIEVADTGVGNPPEERETAWKPIFSRKSSSTPPTLDLTTVRGLVANYGGLMTVSAQPASGTTYRVFLPAHIAESS